jgi:MFS family permease
MHNPLAVSGEPAAAEPGRAYTGYVLGMIFLVAVFNSCDRTIVSVLVEDVRADLALNDRQMGFLLGFAFVLVHFIATIPFARLADRWSRPRIMALGLFSWSVMTSLCGMAQNFTQMAIARMGVGIGEAAGGPAGQALIAEYVPEHKRGKAMSLVTLGGLGGLALGVLYGSWAAQHYGWRFALISVGVAGALFAVLFWLTVSDRRVHHPEAASAETVLQVLRALARKPAYVLMVAGACAVSTGSYGRVLWEPTFLRRIYDMSATEAGGWYFVIGPLPSALGAVLAGVLIDRLSHRDPRWYGWVPALSSLAIVPLSLLFYLSPEGPLLAGVMPVAFIYSILVSVLAAAWVPAVMCTAQRLAPPGQLALTAGVWGMLSSFIGFGVGPMLVGDFSVRLEQLYGDESVRYALAATNVATLMGVVFFLLLAGRLHREP